MADMTYLSLQLKVSTLNYYARVIYYLQSLLCLDILYMQHLCMCNF